MRILDENTLDSRIEAVENPSAVIETLESNKIPFSTPNSSDYESLRLPYNVRLQPKPAIIVIPETPQQVSEAIRAAAQSGIKVQARSGGHSYASFSVGGQDGSMIIDLREFHDVEVLEQFTDPETGEVLKGVVAKVGGGVRLGNMARKIYEQGKRALPHGTGSAVGIGGHATLGGYGYVSRAWGLALDRIVAMDVVLANGRIVHASAKENEDVFWAVRGAAHSFAVVLNFYMRTEEAPREVTYVEIEWDGMYDNKDRFADTFLGIQQLVTDGQVVDARLSFGVRIDGGSYKVTGGFIGSAEELKKKVTKRTILLKKSILTLTRSCHLCYRMCHLHRPRLLNLSNGLNSWRNVPTKAPWTSELTSTSLSSERH
jgi:FAD/FMN-containing dehydrogenase